MRRAGSAACRWAVIVCEIMGWLIASPANAHHSAAMFDQQKALTLQGTVKEFQWTNPHCWIELLVAAPGGTRQWSIEMIAPSQLYRLGWRPGSIRIGEQLTVVVNPVRDGTQGGQFVSAISADGRHLGYGIAPGAKP